MLMLNQLSGFSAGGAVPASISYIGTTQGGPSQNFTFNTVSIGAADLTRRIIAAILWDNTVVHPTISSFTIDMGAGAVSMGSPHVSASAAGGFAGGDVGIYSILAPTAATTANFQINTSSTNSRMNLMVFRALNESLSSPFATMSDNSLTGQVLNGTINIPGSGWFLGAAMCAGSGITDITWSGTTEVADVTRSSTVRVTAELSQLMAAETGRAISTTQDGTVPQGCLAGISWN